MNDISALLNACEAFNLHEVIDHDRFNQYVIVHSSSTIEGSTLTENETRVLPEDGITPKSKPLSHSLMVQDHFNALTFALGEAKKKTPVTVDLMQQINAQVMKSTGKIYNTIFG